MSPSNYHWVNYDPQKLEARYYSHSSARRGTDLHRLAQEAIRLRIFMDPSNEAFAEYVNDCIEWEMTPEQPLYYSENCFGTPDAIRYDTVVPELDMALLRISDLKTGITTASEKQLEVYSALFFLEYGMSPFETHVELRIYQRDEVRLFEPSPEGIIFIMDKIIEFDSQIELLKEAQT